MDNLTHGLVGAAISKAGAERATPLATATLVVAANAPDVDVLSYLGGEYFALSFRRGLTHGWPALIGLSFLVTATMLAWDRGIRRRRKPDAPPARPGALLGLSAVGVATHPALDWMNTYGMRWGLPFDPSWSYGDALFIIDPWVWLVLGGSLLVAARWRRSAGRGEAARRWPVRVGLAAVVVYIGAMVGSDLLASRQVAEAASARGLTVRDVMVAPSAGNPLGAEIEVLTDEGYVPGDFRWTRTPRIRLHPERIVPFLQHPAGMANRMALAVVDAARADRNVRLYHDWSRYPYARIDPNGEGWRVTFTDARYDSGPGAGALGGPTVTVSREEISWPE